jgi:lysophospholipase L1-like esterase
MIVRHLTNGTTRTYLLTLQADGSYSGTLAYTDNCYSSNGSLIAANGYNGTEALTLTPGPSTSSDVTSFAGSFTDDGTANSAGQAANCASATHEKITFTGTAAPTLSVTPVTGSPMTRFTSKVQGSCPDTQQILVHSNATNSYLTGNYFAVVSDDYTDSADPTLTDRDFKVGELGSLRVDLMCDLNVVASVPITVAGTSYVAMGDSYSAGEGAAESSFQPDTVGPDPKTGTSTGCHRSPTAWAGSVALRLKLTNWEFAACSGAQVEQFYNTNVNYQSFETELPQLLAVDPSVTTLVTLTIGGNDVGFTDVLNACLFGGKGATGSTGCSQRGTAIWNRIEGRDGTLASLSSGISVPGFGTKSLADVYVDIAQRVKPGGQVVVAGYPHLFGSNRNFYQTGPYYNRRACHVGTAAGDVPGVGGNYWVDYQDAQWINDVTDRGDAIINQQVNLANSRLRAMRSGTVITYAPAVAQFANHGLCDRDTSYINGLQIDTIHETYKQTSFHPNYNGQRAYARAVIQRIR